MNSSHIHKYNIACQKQGIELELRLYYYVYCILLKYCRNNARLGQILKCSKYLYKPKYLYAKCIADTTVCIKCQRNNMSASILSKLYRLQVSDRLWRDLFVENNRTNIQ